MRTEVVQLQKEVTGGVMGEQRGHLRGRVFNPSWVCKKVSQKNVTRELVLGEMRPLEERLVGQRDEAVHVRRDKPSICTTSLRSPCDESA